MLPQAAMRDEGLQPCVMGALLPRHAGATVGTVARGLQGAHEAYWRLHRPVSVHPTAWSPQQARAAANPASNSSLRPPRFR